MDIETKSQSDKADALRVCLPPGCRELNYEICMKLLSAAGLPENIIRHVKAVSLKALELADALGEKGLELDKELIQNSALLHDICRQEKNHAAAGAELVAALGFIRESEIIRQHHELDDSSLIDEAAVVYLADKLIKEDRPVSLQERFRLSEEKCRSPEARKAHDRRFAQALQLMGRIQDILSE